MSDLGTDSDDSSRLAFQGHREWAERVSDHPPFRLSPVSHHYGTPQVYSVRHGDGRARLVLMSHKSGLALPRSVHPRFRNIDLIPFRDIELRLRLGPTTLRLMTHRRRTLSLTVAWILTMLRCYYYQDQRSRPVHGSSRPHFYPTGTLRYRITHC